MAPSPRKGFGLVAPEPEKQKGRNPKKKRILEKGERPKETIGCFFLDSGAHSLFNLHAHGIDDRKNKKLLPLARRYDYYETDAFWEYVDKYAAFVKENIAGLDYYANVDVIQNPKLSWKVQKYLENTHGLNPVPVIHHGTDVKWLKRHLKAGYDYIGIGGVALEGSRTSYLTWADAMFKVICDNKKNIPSVRVHGFAMTAWESLIRYPWFSVDSTSWAKAGGFGMIYVPRKIEGEYALVPHDINDRVKLLKYKPYNLCVSQANRGKIVKGTSGVSSAFSAGEKQVLKEWLDVIDVPLGVADKYGEMIEWGVVSHHAARKIANLRYFDMLSKALPEWPWSYTAHQREPIGNWRTLQ